MRRWVFGFASLSIALLGLGTSAFAASDIAPAPRRMPREPVASQLVSGSRTSVPPSRTVEGTATILDTERFRVGDIEVRLFGVVPPQLSASFGPQARAVLDSMNAAGPVSCTIRDRDRDGRFLATCLNARQQDFSLELLKRGLAASARGSLRPTDLATPYLAAEQAAQAQKLGIWTVNVPAAVTESNIKAAQQAKEEKEKEAQAAKEAQQKAAEAQQAQAQPQPEAQPIPVVTNLKAETNAAGKAPVPAQKPDMLPQPQSPTPDEIQAALGVAKDDAMTEADVSEPDFIERYQMLLTGVLMLITVLCAGLTVLLHRRIERREERRSIAAALRGELMAARAVCLARLQTMTGGTEDKAAAWPKIRTLVFQAYVGRIGQLGSDLARQIASIYGLASDYAAYYGAMPSGETKQEPVSKRQSLEVLVHHIDQVLPVLAQIENPRAPSKSRSFAFAFSWPKRAAKSLRPTNAKPAAEGGLRQDVQAFFKSKPRAEKFAFPTRPVAQPFAASAPIAPQSVTGEPPRRADVPAQQAMAAKPVAVPPPPPMAAPVAAPVSAPVAVAPVVVQETPKNVARPVAVQAVPVPSKAKNVEHATAKKETPVALQTPAQPKAQAEAPKPSEPVAQPKAALAEEAFTFPDDDAMPNEPMIETNEQVSPEPREEGASVPPASLWGMLRKLASEHRDRAKDTVGDDYVPDYSNMTEAEMEALAYGLEPIDELPVPATRGGRGGRRR